MSSPIRHAKDLDAALIYAPPWARSPERVGPMKIAAPPIEALRDRQIRGARRSFSGDRAMKELQRQLALNPDKVPEPPVAGAPGLWPIALRLSVLTGVATLIAWAIVVLPGIRTAGNDIVLAAASPSPIANRVKLVYVRPMMAALSVAPDRAAAGDAPPPPAQTAAVPSPQPSASRTLVLDDDELAMLVRRGKDFLTTGDLASARLLLQRAAEAGSAEAALALGASFDPLIIERLGAVGATPDIGRAREWYQRAMQLGSSIASKQVAKLSQEPR